MRRLISRLFILIVLIQVWSCSDDDSVDPSVDNVQEFVFLTDTTFLMSEGANSTDDAAIEINAEMFVFEPRDADVILTLEVVDGTAVVGSDYEVVSESNQIVIPAGALRSTTGFLIKTIDNNLQSSEERSFSVRISGVSDDRLNIGLGVEDVVSDRASISILDDECPDTIEKFDGATWSFSGSNTVYYSDYSGSYTTAVSGLNMTIVGDIANYDVGITMDATLVPNGPGSTSGVIEFDNSTVENGDDGYIYRWILKSGTYEVCTETMNLTTNIQYIADTDDPNDPAVEWIDWYDSEISATIESLGGGGGVACEPGGTLDGETVDFESTFEVDNADYPDGPNSVMSSSGSGISLSVNDDCTQLTISGDFLALEQYFGTSVVFNITPSGGDPKIGTISTPTQIIGNDGYFDYRIGATENVGSYNLETGTIQTELFVEYGDDGTYLFWYNAVSTFTIN
ncbi:MAG: hypothetical protein HRT61_23620 [Ekhidna sp.]|nr:hypothetical protein [Ekhidna sp.]